MAILTLSGLFSLFSVYDSDRIPFAERFLFWGSTIGAGWLAVVVVRPWVEKRLLADHSTVIQLLTISAIVSIPIPIILLWFDTHFKHAWPISNWAYQYFLTYVIVILILGGNYVVLKAFGPKAQTTAPDDATGIPPTQTFLKRLPIEFHGATLYAISSEDHYLRIHTDRGDQIILMRLVDALHELDTADGIQTHRSWWVACAGVAKITGKSGKKSLILRSGAEVPIARSREKKVRETLNC